MSLQKYMIISALKTQFIGATRIMIDIKQMKVIVETPDGTREEPAQYAEYFAMVCEAYGLKEIQSIFVNLAEKDILIRGISLETDEQKDVVV